MVWLLINILLATSCSWARSYKDFPVVNGTVGKHQLQQIYIANSDADRSLGLMNVTQMNQNAGVLFIFDQEQILSFWMKNTFIPLTIGFFDSNGCLIESKDMDPVSSVLQSNPPQYQSSKPARFALEVNQGWFAKNGIKVGQGIAFHPSKSQLSSLSPDLRKLVHSLAPPSKCPAGKDLRAN